jgi:LysM repeat protein
VVKKGDTIGHIADWYDVATWRVRSWNKTSNNIRVGQKLYVYVPKDKVALYEPINSLSYAEKQQLRDRKQKENYLAQKQKAEVSSTGKYTIKRNDTLVEIAKKYGTTVDALRLANDIKGSRIYPGQEIKIPGATDDTKLVANTTQEKASSDLVTYTVQRNDTLIEIAKSFGTTIGELRRLNKISGSRIYPGQKLIIRN